MTDISIKPIESQEEYWAKQKLLKNLKIMDFMLKSCKNKTINDFNNAFITEGGMPKAPHQNQTTEIISHVENLGLITVDYKTQIITISKSFPYYLSQLHKIIKNYENKIDREKKLR